VREGSFVRPRLVVIAAAAASVVALLVFANSGGAAGTPTGATPGGGKAGPASTRPVQSAPTREVNSRPANRSVASKLAARRGALLRRADLKTDAGVKAYLRAVGINPRGVVIQRGLRNYAGRSCPGARWSCTSTAHSVVQIARAGGMNRFACVSSHCTVVQAAFAATATNVAKCVKTTGLTQSCLINQTSTSADNEARVYENAGKKTGLTQTATYTASITQTAGSGHNRACVYQEVNIDGSTNLSGKKAPVTVALEAHQGVTIDQDSASGGNDAAEAATTTADACTGSSLVQNQTLTSAVTGSGPITQNENIQNSANIALDIRQNQDIAHPASGENKAVFTQTSNLGAVASTPSGPVNQTQGSNPGGLLAKVNQYSTDLSTANATQTETQCAHAQAAGVATGTCTPGPAPSYTLVQKQFGPIGSGGVPPAPGQRSLQRTGKGICPPDCSSQTGNGGDTFAITQTSNQANDTGQSQNQSNDVQGDCTTSGTATNACHVSQNTNINGTPSNNTQDGSTVNSQIGCTGSVCSPTTSFLNTDVAEFGLGGMRGNGTGSITVSGITGTVTRALLYWNGPTNTTTPSANAAVTFAGTPVTGTNIGVASDNNWGFLNTQSYKADVTSLVSGDGAYSLADFLKPGIADINGVALIVFYDDGNSANDRNVVVWNGNDSNVTLGPPYNPDPWNQTLAGVPYPGSGAGSLDLVVADGQSIFNDDALVLNGSTLVPAGAIFSGDSTPPFTPGGLWDIKSFDITSFLQSGSNLLHLTSGVNADFLSMVVALANMPAS